MKTLYSLNSCSTCKRIIETLNLPEDVNIRDIKKEPLTAPELETMAKMTGSYESLFSKRAQLYRQRGLKDKNLTESDIKDLILEHYTFLSRPVLVFEDQIFVGNSAKTVEAAKAFIHNHD